MKKKTFVLYLDWCPLIFALSDEQAGVLFKSLFRYQIGEEVDIEDPMTSAIYKMIVARFEVDSEKYEAICERNRINGAKGGRPKQSEEVSTTKPSGFFGKPKITQNNPKNPDGYFGNPNDNDNDNDNDKDIKKESRERKTVAKATTPFRKPSVEEVREYCEQRGNHIDPERFVNFYESKGWKVGNQSMKNWKACVITWEKRGNAPGNVKPFNRFNNFDQNQYSHDEMKDLEERLLDN